MTVYVAGYQAVSILHGGPRTQIAETVRALGQAGVEARQFDPWSPFRPEHGDIFHLFAANIGTYHLAREIHALNIPLVVSPITFSRHSSRTVRTALAVTRMAQKAGRGIWSDYALCADICSWADRLLPNSTDEGRLLARGYGVPQEKITVIPNGVEPRFGEADPALFRQTYGLDRFILSVGHTGHERKNVLLLLKALGRIDHPSVVIGRIINSRYGEACVREAERHKQILLLDGMDHASPMLASAYAACDVFVLPSHFETPGIAALEAGLAGAKVAITPYGGTKEYFRDHVEYVEPTSEESIRRGIVQALDRTNDGRLREHIRTHYLWEHVARMTADVYREVLAVRG